MTSADGVFDYPTSGDGTYYFKTIATDVAGNIETKTVSDAETNEDQTKPSSQADSPTYDNSGTIHISSGPADADGNANATASGVKEVKLYVKRPGQASYDTTAAATSTDGVFDYAVPTSAGQPINGSYEFKTIATDKATNAEADSGTDDQTLEDTVKPHSHAASDATNNDGTITVTYAAAGDDLRRRRLRLPDLR